MSSQNSEMPKLCQLGAVRRLGTMAGWGEYEYRFGVFLDLLLGNFPVSAKRQSNNQCGAITGLTSCP
eukprot:scaffold4743_cov171-Amphora_coffeaeformis.AAC.19